MERTDTFQRTEGVIPAAAALESLEKEEGGEGKESEEQKVEGVGERRRVGEGP
jgi:hypothetical protein